MRRLLLSIRWRLQRAVLQTVRGSRLFPRTLVDRLGEDDRLGDARVDAEVMVYFPGAVDTMYQIVPWLPTFEAVHGRHRLVIVCQDSRVARELRRTSRLPVLVVARYGTLDGILGRSDVKLSLYVSHLPRNFESLRFASLLHAYIGHGDSDKGVSASNQLKAYDYVFAPGQAAIDRIARNLIRFDVGAHCRIVGQPLSLSAPLPVAPEVGDGVRTVLYAPTWEGGQPSVAYSSVATHGEALVRSLLGDGRFRVVYRPHPLIGVSSGVYGAADQAVRGAIAEAASADPQRGHAVVPADEESLEETFARADALVCDVSAVATAWLPCLRPIVVTEPTGDSAVAADSGMLSVLPRLAVEAAPSTARIVGDVLADDRARDRRAELVALYLSPYWPDRVMERFVEVCSEVIAERDAGQALRVTAGATGI